MRCAAAALVLLALFSPQGSAAQTQGSAREMMLNLPRPLAAGETAFIEVALGALARGQSVEVTAAGRSLGVIAPFGMRAGQDSGSYTLPVPPDAIRDGGVALRLTVRQGDTARAPTTSEVRGVKLSIVGAR
jgi:hypothetical protein